MRTSVDPCECGHLRVVHQNNPKPPRYEHYCADPHCSCINFRELKLVVADEVIETTIPQEYKDQAEVYIRGVPEFKRWEASLGTERTGTYYHQKLLDSFPDPDEEAAKHIASKYDDSDTAKCAIDDYRDYLRRERKR